MMWVVSFLIGVWALVVPGIHGQIGQRCSPGWTAFNGRCFLPVSGENMVLPATHEGRRIYCLGLRGDLAKLDPPATFQVLLPLFVNDLTEFYIGLTDQRVEGDFRWVRDDTVPTSVLWGGLQPDGGVEENCVVASGSPPTWSDTLCARRRPFLCERPADNPACGAGPFATRIVGGSPTTPGVWPWQGSIAGKCGATLISEEWAVTAAHCLGAGAIFFGDISQSVPSSTRQESEISWFLDPRYNPLTFEYDLALLYLHAPISFNNFIQPACIYNTVTNPAADPMPPEVSELVSCYITGWGDLMEDAGNFPDILQEAPVDLFTPAVCGNYGERFNERIHLCAGSDNGQIDTCQGDSGGPLVCRDQRDLSTPWTLAGVVSFGDGCARPGFPGVYTRLSTTRSFVDDTRLADGLMRCGGNGGLILGNQACDTIVDCDDYSDELGCDRLESGETILMNSPKWDQLTNFIRRRWIFFPAVDQPLTISFSLNTIPGSGSLTTLANIDGALPVNVPARDPNLGTTNPFTVIGSMGQPVVVFMEKQTIQNIAGFRATITSG